MIITKLTKAVYYEEILEEIRHLLFTGLAELLLHFVDEHLLKYDEVFLWALDDS